MASKELMIGVHKDSILDEFDEVVLVSLEGRVKRFVSSDDYNLKEEARKLNDGKN